jgi:hypothetical protein
MTAPHRQKKHDRLTYGSQVTPKEIACDFALGPLDRVAMDMDRIWGVDRLVELQTPAVAAKYGARMAELNAAIVASDPESTAAVVAILIANLRRMDALAREAGHQPLQPEVWTFDVDGFRFGLMREGGDWPAAQAAMPGLALFSPREIANALKAYRGLVADAKRAFPGREAKPRQRTELEESLNDEIPY